jgi:hypothetical protein
MLQNDANNDLFMGESTLQGGPKMLSHYIVFQGCPCLNFNHGDIGTYFSKKIARYGIL